MNKYIPKVGEAFEWQTLGGWKKENAVVFENEKQIVVINCKGFIEVISKSIDFRPAPTKADLERQELLLILDSGLSDESTVSAMLLSGFTIPKKVKRSDIADAIYNSIADVTDIQSKYAANKVCNLLGDLVEQDEGGVL
jgi:hypothetical protein